MAYRSCAEVKGRVVEIGEFALAVDRRALAFTSGGDGYPAALGAARLGGVEQ